MVRKYNIEFLDYWQITLCYYIAKLMPDEGIDDDRFMEDKKTILLHLGIFIQCKKK